jgi:hypothetical protein
MKIRDVVINLTSGMLMLPVLIIGVLCAPAAVAQLDQPHRYERVQKGSDDYFTIISLQDEGLCLLRHKDKYNKGKRVWEFVLVDTALVEKKSVTFEVDTRNNLLGYEYVPGVIFFLYRTGETTKNTLELIEFNTQGDELGRYEIKPELDFKITHFIKVGAKMVFGGYVNKDPVILIYEMATNLIKVVPGFFQKENELVDLRANQNKTFNVILIDRSAKAEKKLNFRTFDENGELLLEDVVPIEDKKSLQTSITSTLEREELFAMGTWGDRQGKQSAGFFTIKVDPFSDQKINYFDFASLTHFLDFIKPKRADRIRENSAADIEAGRNPDYANYVMPFKIVEHPTGFLMLAEVYNPVSTSNQYNSFNSNAYSNMGYGNPYLYNPYYPGYYFPSRMYRPYTYGNNIKNADEIKTTQSVLLAFDATGNLLWDQGMKIDNISRTSLEQVSDFYYDKNKISLVCKNKEAELQVRFIRTDNSESQELKTKIVLSDPLDEFRSEKENEGGIRQWYKNSFYVWGYQTIRNLNNKEDRIRDVFYINKVVVR